MSKKIRSTLWVLSPFLVSRADEMLIFFHFIDELHSIDVINEFIVVKGNGFSFYANKKSLEEFIVRIIINTYFCTRFQTRKLIFNNKNNFMNHYETVFILNPVLSADQIKETVKKYEDYLTSKGAKMIAKEDWGLKKLAYPIQNKKSGFYHLLEYTVDGEVINPLEVEFRRDERFMRYLTVKLDKHAVAWAERRRKRDKANAKAKA